MQLFYPQAYPVRHEYWRYGPHAPFLGTGPYGHLADTPPGPFASPASQRNGSTGASPGSASTPSGQSPGHASGPSSGFPAAVSGSLPEYPARQPTGVPYGHTFAHHAGPPFGTPGLPGYVAGGLPFSAAIQTWPIGWYGPMHPAWRSAHQGAAPPTRESAGEAEHSDDTDEEQRQLRDYGPDPFVTDIEDATKANRTFRTALWTGTHLQLVLMSIPAGEDIGLERHESVDQFIRIEEGRGLVQMGNAADRLDFRRAVEEDDVILIPAGTWHNVTNTGQRPLKLYTLYAPPQHPRGTVHATKQEAMAAEN